MSYNELGRIPAMNGGEDVKKGLRLLTLDLGTNFCGVAVVEVDRETLALAKLEAFSFKTLPDYYPVTSEAAVAYHRSTKIRYACDYVLQLCERYCPEMVVLEQPFFSMSFPQAAIPLYQLFHALMARIEKQCPQIELRAITAPKARKLIGFKRLLKADTKEAVKTALLKWPALKDYQATIEPLDEHAADALCVAMATLTFIQESLN